MRRPLSRRVCCGAWVARGWRRAAAAPAVEGAGDVGALEVGVHDVEVAVRRRDADGVVGEVAAVEHVVHVVAALGQRAVEAPREAH